MQKMSHFACRQHDMHFSAKHKENKIPRDPLSGTGIPAQSEKFPKWSEFKLFVTRTYTDNQL